MARSPAQRYGETAASPILPHPAAVVYSLLMGFLACTGAPDRARRWLVPLLLVAFTLPLYVAFQSVSLDDFDSYSFALALGDFDLVLQQPQPPGFPVYVLLGRLLLALTHGPTAALTLLSALSGTLIALLTHELGRATSPRPSLTGVGAAMLVGLLPMGWLTAEKALSDAPGMALTLLAIWLLWRGREDLRWLGVGSLASGLSLGLRPQNSLPVLLLLAGLAVGHTLAHRSLRPLAWVGLPFLIGLLTWLLPTARAVGGLSAYLSHVAAHSAHVRQADSLLGTRLPLETALRARALAFGDTFLVHTIGVGLFNRWNWWDAARALAALAVALPGLIRAGWRQRTTWLLAAWAALAAGQVFVLEALDRPRLMLPLLPPLALLIARGWARLGRPTLTAPAILAVTAIALLVQGLPLAAQLASVPAPPSQAAAFVAAHYPAEETLVAAAGSFRAVQVELPAYRRLYLYALDPDAARAAVAGLDLSYLAVFDRDKFPDEIMTALSGDGRYVPLGDRTFARDARVHTQHDQVRLQILTPAERLPPEALTPPAGGCIDIGSSEDGRYLIRGWYRPENVGGVEARWAGGTLTATVRLYLEPGCAYRLSARALAYPAEQELVLRANGRTVGQFSMSPTWAEYSAAVPASLLSSEGVTAVDLIHARLAAPFTESGGASSDRRPLAAAYDWLCLVAEP